MYRNKLLFVYLCRTFVSNKKKNYEKDAFGRYS